MARLAEATARTKTTLRELQRTNQSLEHLAATDSLTGADNRRRFTEHVEAEIRRVKRGGAPFSVLALDLDNFKSINDRYGHQAGDDILKAFVQKSLAAIRPYDGIARVGGEEFMVLLPQAALDLDLKSTAWVVGATGFRRRAASSALRRAGGRWWR